MESFKNTNKLFYKIVFAARIYSILITLNKGRGGGVREKERGGGTWQNEYYKYL